MLYEKRILNGELIIVVFKPEGVIYAKKKYPNYNGACVIPIGCIRSVVKLSD